MYDFCFTPIYACLLALGGVIGFIARGSTQSLGGGVGSALLLSLFCYISFQQGYKKRQHCRPAVLLSLGVSLALTIIFYQRFVASPKIHTGLIAFISGLMSAYYVWNLTLFRPHFPPLKTA